MLPLRLSQRMVLAALLAVPFLPPAAADHEFELGVFFNWPTKTLDVLVLSGEDPLIGAAIRRAITAWEVGIPQFAPDFGLDLRAYWPADDPTPPADFLADIVVVPQGFLALRADPPFGPDLETPRCYAFAPNLAEPSKLYAVASHEFGHCLGLGHVFNHGVEYSPGSDIMGSGNVAGGACPSNLNVQVLERVFSGQQGTVSMSASQYQQSTC